MGEDAVGMRQCVAYSHIVKEAYDSEMPRRIFSCG